jgi:ATP-dependent helicase HrpB
VFPREAGTDLTGSAWIVAPAVDPGNPLGTIRLAAPLGPEDALAALAPFTAEETVVGWRGLVPVVRRTRRAGKLLLEQPRPAASDPQAVVRSFLARLGTEGAGFLPWTDGSRRFLARLRAFRAWAGIPAAPDDAGLAAQAGEWLVPHLDDAVLSGRRRGPVLTPGALLRAVESLAGARRGDMEKAAPEHLRLPSGARRRIDYSADGPAVDARVQEVFGLRESPVVCGKPLTFRLLSPAGRPLQITRDLAGFWKNTYPGIRREMRGRYPKHRWPEDPFAAPPGPPARPKT